MPGIMYGYIRVSTKEQNEDRQIFALTEYGIKPANIYMDKQSGSNFNRPAYKHLIRAVRRGDIIVIKSIDRLGRNYQDIIDQWRMITQDLGVGIHVLDMPTLNTSGDPKDLMSRFITDMMLQVLSFVAENERVTTLNRQNEGLAALKRREGGITWGRPTSTVPKDFWKYYVMWRRKDFTVDKMCRKLKISSRTFYRRIRELDKRFGDMTIAQIEKMHLTEDLTFDCETEELAKLKEQGIVIPRCKINNEILTTNMRKINRKVETPAPPRPHTEIESQAFSGEFTTWYREYTKLRTRGWLVRTREREKLKEDANALGMQYWQYIDKCVAEGKMGKYCERKGKMPKDWNPSDPVPDICYWTTPDRIPQAKLPYIPDLESD